MKEIRVVRNEIVSQKRCTWWVETRFDMNVEIYSFFLKMTVHTKGLRQKAHKLASADKTVIKTR